ncbi:MAG: M56 family metallopeptidase [Gammaproteobacteria bacterium]
MDANLEFWLIAIIISVLLIALGSALLLPWIRAPLRRVRPELRANVILAWCLAPVALGLIMAFAPGPLSALRLAPAECGRISHGILQLCGPDCAGGTALPVLFDIALGAPLLWFFVAVAGRVRAQARFSSRIGTLIAAGNNAGIRGAWVVESEVPFAFTVGLRRARIVISSSLNRGLSRDQMNAVVAHERAHAQRRDVLRFVAAEAASMAHFPWIRSALLSELRLASEQACDRAAAQETGDRVGMATTLLQVERLFGGLPLESSLPAHVLGGDVEARIEELLRAPEQSRGRSGRFLVAAGLTFCAAVAFGAVPLHELAASLMTLLRG